MDVHWPWLIEVFNLGSSNHTLKYRFELNQGLIDSAYCCSNLEMNLLVSINTYTPI